MASRLARGLGAAAIAGAGAVAWGTVEAHWYTLREFTVPVLPPGADPLTVLHLSDLHLTPGQRRKIDWVRDLASIQPDLVVDTGDNWAHLDAMPALLHALEPHLDTPGVFVWGSNDFFAPSPKNPARYLLPDARVQREDPPTELPWRELGRHLTSAGWIDLDNRRDALEVAEQRISLVGTNDAHLDLDRFPDAEGDIRPVAQRTGPADPARVTGELPALHLGVTHAPYRRVLDAMHADGADLILAGHTHGGQLAVPGYGALVTNCDLDRGRAKGLHGWPGARPGAPHGADSTWLHVCGGLGTSPYAPVRFACRPEAAVLTLVAAS